MRHCHLDLENRSHFVRVKSTLRRLAFMASALTAMTLLAPGDASARGGPTTSQSTGADLRPPQIEASDDFVVRRVRDLPPLKRWNFNYFAEFTGPSADFALPLESYSPYADYYAPMALFQSFTTGYALDLNHRLGFEFSANQPLQENVLDKFYNYYSTEFTVFDPTVFFQANNLLTNSWSWVNVKLSASLPTSKFSREVKKITSFYMGPSWHFRLSNPKWYFSLYSDFYFNLYENPVGWPRFVAVPGHTAGYFFSPKWSLDTNSTFDFNLTSWGNHSYSFTNASVDRLKITLRYQPVVNAIQIGAFLISPIYHRKLERMAVGLNLNVWF